MATDPILHEQMPRSNEALRVGLQLAGGTWRFMRRKPLGAFGAFLVLLVLFLAIFGELIVADPTRTTTEYQQAPSINHFFGTDTLGRDYFARIVVGARTSVILSLSAMAIGTGLALMMGMVSAYAGGMVDLLGQRLVDMLLAFPGLILLLFLAAIFGPSKLAVAIALGLLFSPGLARVIRATTLATISESYVEAARVLGVTPFRILWRHVLPNIAPPLLIFITAGLGAVILAEGALSFLGLGWRRRRRPGAGSSTRAARSGGSGGSACSRASRSRSRCWASTCSAMRCAMPGTRACADRSEASCGAQFQSPWGRDGPGDTCMKGRAHVRSVHTAVQREGRPL